MKKVLLSALVLATAFISCQKDISAPDMPNIGVPKLAAAPLIGSVAGIVVDENNNAVANAQVTVAHTVYATNNKGFFNTAALTLDKNISTVKVKVPGYFTAYRSFSASATKNYVSIKLIPKALTGSFSSSAAGQISLPNGSSISFQANGVNVKSSGAAYSGTVNVYAAYIDPTTADFGAKVPGSMMAEDATNFYTLRSTGMMAVELESAAGEPLQLAAGKSASMKLSIPAALLSKAPATIDTWSLDDRGVWMKEGVATKNGSTYEFQASHFSFWNCDVPTSAVYLVLNLKDQNSNNLVNIPVTLTSSTTFGTTAGLTDSLGNVHGYVPKNESLELKAYAGYYFCNNPFYTQTIGPFAANAALNIVGQFTNSNLWTVSGTATDCSGANVVNGTAIIYSGYYQSYVSITNGSYTATLPSCIPITSISVIVRDNVAQQQSATVTVPVTGNTTNISNISACGITTDEFINYTVDGTNYSINNWNSGGNLYAYAAGASSNLYAYNQLTSDRLSFVAGGNTTGTHVILTDSLTVNSFVNPQTQTGSTATFTTFGPVGQYLEGSFTIPFAATGSIHTLTGTFRMKRYQ